MTVKEVVSKISGADTIRVYSGCEFICEVCKKDYDGWGEDSNGERIIGFTSILIINI